MGACDRQSLVIPFLGLYGVLSRAAHEAKDGGNEDALHSVITFLEEIEKNQEAIFPRTFQRTMWRKNKRVTEEVTLFGDLIDRMRAKVTSGADFNVEEEKAGTMSTLTVPEEGSENFAPGFLGHGASQFIRHGASNFISSSNSIAKVGIETAVETIDEK